MITVGMCGALLRGTASSPISFVNSSLTILTICWAGFNPFSTSAPAAFSRTVFTKSFTTLKLTSASKRASRISRIVSRRSASVTLGLRRNFSIAFCRRSVNPSEKIRCRRAYQIPPITPFPRNVCKKRSIGAQKTKAAHPPAAAFALRVRAWKAKFSSVLRTCGHTPARPPRRAAPPNGTPTAR